VIEFELWLYGIAVWSLADLSQSFIRLSRRLAATNDCAFGFLWLKPLSGCLDLSAFTLMNYSKLSVFFLGIDIEFERDTLELDLIEAGCDNCAGGIPEGVRHTSYGC